MKKFILISLITLITISLFAGTPTPVKVKVYNNTSNYIGVNYKYNGSWSYSDQYLGTWKVIRPNRYVKIWVDKNTVLKVAWQHPKTKTWKRPWTTYKRVWHNNQTIKYRNIGIK